MKIIRFITETKGLMPFIFRRRRIKKIRKSPANRAKFLAYKAKAQQLAQQKIAHFNAVYQFKVNKISIKNQKTRWGSCSKKGNLNFNYKIALLPDDLADYVIVHELCHLAEFNHSTHFWNLVAKTIPNYREIKKAFKKIHL